jgi:hypothetical protein
MTRRTNGISSIVGGVDHARFSAGMEALEETPEKEHRGRFSAGQECRPSDVPGWHVGRFSEGQQLLAETPREQHRGRFSEGQEVSSRNLHLAA